MPLEMKKLLAKSLVDPIFDEVDKVAVLLLKRKEAGVDPMTHLMALGAIFYAGLLRLPRQLADSIDEVSMKLAEKIAKK